MRHEELETTKDHEVGGRRYQDFIRRCVRIRFAKEN
jgi:hypothetical protein